MEDSFVWILLLAGGALTLFGALLIASERELKSKRREVEALLSKLEGLSEGLTPAGSALPETNHSAELNELRAQNRELQKQIAALSGELDLSRQQMHQLTTAEQTSARNLAEIQELRTTNERLRMEISQLHTQLANSEAQLRSSAAPDAMSQAQIETEAEINALKEKLHQSDIRMHSLEARNAHLERTLTAAEQSVSELEHLRARLQQAEREQQGFREEIRQREQQLVQFQARAAEAEEHRQRLAALQTPYLELLSKQASLAEKQRELQADLEAFARLMNHSET